MSLKTNYKDEMLKSGEQRRYNLVASNGSTLYSNVRLEKAYTPQVEGDKFSAKDINDTNRVVNDLDESYRTQYSLSEKFTGKYWINGKKIFRKVIMVNANNTPHKIVSLHEVISLTAMYHRGNTYGKSNCSNDVTIQQQNIYLLGDASQYVSSSNAITVIIEYTKMTA
jgi:hypothetical protein